MNEKMPSGEKKRTAFHVLVSGSVQGVGFRAFTVALARKTGIVGTVANLDDGSVEIIAEGSRASIDAFVDGLRHGNGWSRTDRVSLEEIRSRGYTSFEVVL